MDCFVYIKKYSYEGIERGQRKKAESANGLDLLSYALADHTGLTLSKLEIARGEHGKPYFPTRRDICFNISHSGDYAAAAVCCAEVGVDIQTYRSVKDNMIARICSDIEREYIENAKERERAFIYLWALKESYIKAIGRGMTYPMDKVNFDLRSFDGEYAENIPSNREGTFYLHDHGEFALALCVLTENDQPLHIGEVCI